ncbi:uncharacterized protein NFIA_025090 [Aspergillus fischeri NRRL 181]|uniref:Uncharacterized protein n=1 Tax=Neosartorya fischeri (strain ATCC 1020 / DSM 3700 / CBS 544.65 / FGSC A1164 / JCM 1740 / NRRL 181 / WB 181) TaxID=331117 RepID=A1DC77_NEOFI|nr:uncharacterized protein NFIA_025090 [Aspergillus fischeri NRRL 181]EAW19437.1 hypothetical protein NFIA_025090 [Aspergillus fischeri NRRL 181]KAG2014698.1 hypothetical protein GB937_006417 [Aspergillus fischeri]
MLCKSRTHAETGSKPTRKEKHITTLKPQDSPRIGISHDGNKSVLGGIVIGSGIWEIHTPQEEQEQPLQSLEQAQELQEQGVILIELVVNEAWLEEERLFSGYEA